MRISDWSSDVCSSDLDDMPYGLPNGIGPEVTAMKEAGVDYVITAFDQGGALALEQELERQGMSDVLVQLPQDYADAEFAAANADLLEGEDRKSTRLNSSH